jgi:hypothetical protein
VSMSTKTPCALALVVVAMALAACTSSPTVSPSTTTTKPLPAIDLSATPAGWVPVADGGRADFRSGDLVGSLQRGLPNGFAAGGGSRQSTIWKLSR